MRWIGITGEIGSGKSSVTKILNDLGYHCLSADEIVHNLYKKNKSLIDEVKYNFGNEVLNKNNEIDRKILYDKIKSDVDSKILLEKIVHPYVRIEVSNLKKKLKDEYFVFYEIPLLFENNLEKEFDIILFIDSPNDIIKNRLKNRNGWSEVEIDDRLSWFLPKSDKIKKSHYIIQNNGSFSDLKSAVQKVLSKLPRD